MAPFSKCFSGAIRRKQTGAAGNVNVSIDGSLFRTMKIDNVGTGSGVWLREPPKVEGVVSFQLELRLIDAGTAATVGIATAAGVSTTVFESTVTATENGLGGI